MVKNKSKRRSYHPSLVIIDGRVRWDAFSSRHKCVAIELSQYRDVIYLEDGGSLVPQIREISPSLVVVSGILRWYERNVRKPNVLIPIFPATYLNVLSIKYKHVVIWAMGPCHDLLPGVRATLRIFDHIDPCFSDDTSEIVAFNSRVISMSKKADIVFATAQALLEECEKYNQRSYLVENGTPIKNIVESDFRDIDLVWLGTLDSRIDYQFLNELASGEPGIRIVLAGNVHPDYRNVVNAIPNVEHVGPLSDEDGDTLLLRSKYGAIPYISGPISERINPCKIFSYIASGVVPISLPSSHAARLSGYCLMSSDSRYWLSATKQRVYPPLWYDRDSFVQENTWLKRVELANKIVQDYLCERSKSHYSYRR
jgi:hypothetical protein